MSNLSRRSLLAGAAGTAGLALAACQTSTPPGTPPSSNSSSAATTKPKFIPFAAAKPEIVGDGALGIPDLYTSYPDPPPKAYSKTLPKVEPIQYLAQTPATMVPAAGNPWFAQLTTLLGTELKVIPGTYAQYNEKFQTLVASGDLPEVMQVPPLPALPKLLESQFTDLTPYLGGDAIAQYPGLASTPSPAWDVATLNGKVWGTVNSRVPSATVLAVRGDAMQAKGIDPTKPLADGEEFVSMMTELGDPARKVYAFGEDPITYMQEILLQIVGAPNVWSEVDGKFTHVYETEQYKQALEINARLWKAGVYHPNSIIDNTQIRGWFDSGVTLSYAWSMSGWGSLAEANPDWNIILLDLPQWGGGAERAKVFDGQSAYFAFNAISKQTSEARVREILEVLNMVAAPWGTQEFLDVSYGIKDTHYTLQSGQLTALPKKADDVMGWIGYAGTQGGQVLFNAKSPDIAKRQYEYMKAIRPTVVANPTVGLYSDTMTSKGATMGKAIADTLYQVIQGNQPMSAWETLVKQWQTQIGNAAREEYAAAKG